jgi:hypothetical protein
MSTNAKDMPIVKLESPRFEDSRPLLIAGWGVATPLTLSMIWRRCGSASRFAAVESPDK